MRQALLIIDVQPSFAPPQWLVDGIQTLIGTLPSVATVERHDETKTHSKNNSAVTRRRMMPA
jgi:nicotinamidase-related amidase